MRSPPRPERRWRPSRSPGPWPSGIVAALASATSVDQLHELTAALNLTLDTDQLARLDAASAETEPAAA